jgi:hypothetical protein
MPGGLARSAALAGDASDVLKRSPVLNDLLEDAGEQQIRRIDLSANTPTGQTLFGPCILIFSDLPFFQTFIPMLF